MDRQSFGLRWVQQRPVLDRNLAMKRLVLGGHQQLKSEESMVNGNMDESEYLIESDGDATTEADIDQIAAENLIFMAHDGQSVGDIITTVGTTENGAVVVAASDGNPIDCAVVMQEDELEDGLMPEDEQEDFYAEEMVTEEVITDDWVQPHGEECVEIPAEQIIGSGTHDLLEVPLPTVQDEYSLLRPYPCDFCSRRFRKKASLLSHMVAHQNDRPHLCKLCGSRFFRRNDLLNHLQTHAETPDPEFEDGFITLVEQTHSQTEQRQSNDHYYDHDWSMQPEAIAIPTKSGGKYQMAASGNSSSASSSTTAARGRISRLKPKEENNYTIDESLKQRQRAANDAIIDYAELHHLQASTATVKIVQDQLPEMQRRLYPIIDDSKPFVCQQCGLAFARQKALLSHTKNHRKDSPFECNVCNEMFWDAVSLKEHQKTHQFEDSNSEYDPAEGDDSQSESEQSEEQTYGEFYCSECGMSFHRQDLLKRHGRDHLKSTAAAEVADNDQDVKYRHCCNNCGETFNEALDLLAHAEIHARHPPFKCVLCGESFFEENTIKRHLQSMHAGEMTTNSCILCGKECRDRKALIKHAWDHSREKCHSCSKCGKSFHNKARLKRHMVSHRNKSVICAICHEELPDGRSLSNHRHSHSTTSTGKMFPCHECGKTFGSRSSQQIHVRIHTGERPYGCRFCWKAFADGGTLRKHERIHTGEKPYACSVCRRAFNQRVVLREHIRSHHSGLDIRRGTYFCSVCSTDMPSSNELIQHLIQHSDTNTAMQRQPITGPRKYKRRRKLKPNELARMRNENKVQVNDYRNDQQDDNADTQDDNGQEDSEVDMSDFDIETADDYIALAEQPKTVAVSGNRANVKRGRRAAGAVGNANANNSFAAQQGIVGASGSNQKQKRHNSNSSSSDKWPAKLESYKSLFSNVENTLQNIDALVVGGSRSRKMDSTGESTAQRTQQVQINKQIETTATSAAGKNRRKPAAKSLKPTRPRMIHTKKESLPLEDNSKRRSRSYITQRSGNLVSSGESMHTSSAIIVNDYEIIMPESELPNQISSSPVHIKQEQHEQQQLHHARNHDNLYEAQLLLDAAIMRKDNFEKFNPAIVNDLEDILRSPLKSERNERQRFNSESSNIPYIAEQSEEEQHIIKIEPTSPVLIDIIEGGNSERRSTRSRCVAVNRRYLEFETHSPKRGATSSTNSSRKTAKSQRNSRDVATKSYMGYGVDAYATVPAATGSSGASSAYSSISAVVAAAESVAAAAPTVTAEPKRYFECEMCSAVFSDRAQLLDHVPIHI